MTEVMFHRGAWVDAPDIMGMQDSALREAAGWKRTEMFLGGDPLEITVWDMGRDDMPWYCLDVMNLVGGLGEIYAGNQGDVIDLLARWAPAVQAAALAWITCNLNVSPGSVSATPLSNAIAHAVSLGVTHGMGRES